MLANDFNRMGARLQSLIASQRQLLRDVSHELRSPLARLRIALALAERAEPAQQQAYWPRLTRECDRLEALISEILVLARVDAESASAEPVDLNALLASVRKDAQLAAPEQDIQLHDTPGLSLQGWPTLIERALDNLLRNAVRFNPPGQPIEMSAQREGERIVLTVRDHGPGWPTSTWRSWASRFPRSGADHGRAWPGPGDRAQGGGTSWWQPGAGQPCAGRVRGDAGVAGGGAG